VRLANQVDQLSRLGAEVVLASADPPAAQLAMNRTWHLPCRWVSDPDGERLGRPLGSWNPDERGGIFLPLVLLVAPDGQVVVRHRSRDFADREDDRDVLAALAELQLPPQPVPPAWSPAGVEPQPTDSAFRPEAFGAYFRGLRSGTRALAGRMRDEHDAAELRQTSEMAGSFLDAWTQRRADPGGARGRP
jgi:hypothetical protein